MGKGVGKLSYWATKISKGDILFELNDIPEKLAIKALLLVQKKLPIKTKVISEITK